MDNITDFITEISSSGFTIPVPIQIAAYIIFGAIITAVVFLFRDSFESSTFRDSYMWYYAIAIFNILNICAVLWFYWRKSGSFVGPAGDPGHLGQRGELGENMNCTLCSNNIYLLSTTRYDLITRVDFMGLANTMISPQLANGLKLAERVLQNDLFDYAEFGQTILNNTFDLKNKITRTIFTLSVYNEFPLINFINRNLGLSDSKATGYFQRPFGKLGYFSLGDTAFGGGESYKPTAYMVNGDIRCPTGFDVICTFVTTDDRGQISKYSILRMIPPILEPPADQTNEPIATRGTATHGTATRGTATHGTATRDLTRKYKDDQYRALGQVVYYHNPAKPGAADPLLFACVKESCCRRLDPARLKLMFIYPGASSSQPNKNQVNEIEQDISAGQTPTERVSEGFFSVWRTPFNTIVTKFSNRVGWSDGVRIIELVYQNSPDLYNKDGSIKAVMRTRLDAFMAKIRLPKIVIASVLFAATLERVKLDLQEFAQEFVTGRGEIMQTENLRKFAENPADTTVKDVSLALADISAAISASDSAAVRQAEREILKREKSLIRTLAEVDDPESHIKKRGKPKVPGQVSYNLVKAYDALKIRITEMSVKIENGKSMLDVFKALFPDGLSTRLDLSMLTPTLSNILNLVCVLVPPREDVWVIDNRCLVYEQVDEVRLVMAGKVEEEVKKFNGYVRDFRDEGMDAPTVCGGERGVKEINKMVKETHGILTHQLGHIPDFMDKLNRAELDEMTDSNLEVVLGQLRKLNDFIGAKCGMADG